MNFDLGAFKSESTVNTRKSSGTRAARQTFADLKFRKSTFVVKEEGKPDTAIETSKFLVSTKRFKELNLAVDQLRPFFNADKTQVILGVVDPEHGQLLKAREGKKKGKGFKSEKVAKVLYNNGILDPNAVVGMNQFVKLEQIGQDVIIDGIPVKKAFALVKGEEAQYQPESPIKARKAKKAAAAATADAPVANAGAATPVADAQAAPVAANDDWN